jgi:hypothetical protein
MRVISCGHGEVAEHDSWDVKLRRIWDIPHICPLPDYSPENATGATDQIEKDVTIPIPEELAEMRQLVHDKELRIMELEEQLNALKTKQ